MLVPEAQYLPDLPIRQWRLVLPHTPRHRRFGRISLQHLSRRLLRRDGVICRIEHLKAQPVLLHAQVANLAQIPGINVTPRIPLTCRRFVQELGEQGLILVGLDDIADPQRINIHTGESPCKAPCTSLATKLACRIGILRIVVVVFL